MESSNIFSRLALGTVQFGMDYGISNTSGKTNIEEVKQILKIAREAGIHTLDTAASYGYSEKIIGDYGEDNFDIISKFPNSVTTPLELATHLEQSLMNLKNDHLYGYLSHDAATILTCPDIWDTLLRLKDKGVVKKIGYSLYLPEQLNQLLSAGFVPDIVQVPYNFIDRRFEKYFEQLQTLGCEIHTRSVFLQGLFFLNPAKLNEFFKPIRSLMVELRQNIDNDNELANFLMSFVLSNERINKLIFGVNTSKQLLENIGGFQLSKINIAINWDLDVAEDILMPNKWPKI